MRVALSIFCILMLSSVSVTSAQTTVFDHDFQNSTPGDLAAAGALGDPVVGTLSTPGGFVSTTLPAYTTGNNGTFNAIVPVADGSFNDVGTPAGNFLTAELSEPAAVTSTLGAGQTTTVSFRFSGFGTSNQTAFKYAHFRGVSSTGQEVFQLLYRAGSGGASRQLFARELGEDNTTFVNDTNPAGAFSSVDGTLILGNISFTLSSINTDIAPSGQVTVSIVIDDAGWNVSAEPTGGQSASTPASGLGIASGATDLASIVFFTSHNQNVNGQNKGVWVDNIVVATDLTVEPGTALPGDFEPDGDVDVDDIDFYFGNIGSAADGELAQLDFDGDGQVTFADAQFHIENLVQTSNGETGTFLGDLNLDGEVNVLGDAFVLVANLGNPATSYGQGDINLDGEVNVLGDAFSLVGNLGNSNAQ